MSFFAKVPWLSLLCSFVATGCSSGGSALPASTPTPTIVLSAVTVTCGTTTVFGPASVTVAPTYGAGSSLPLSSSCPTGSVASVRFTPLIASSTLGTYGALVFDLMPNSSTSSTAVGAADATGFDANVVQTGLGFTTVTLAPATYLYAWLAQLEPQGD